MEISDYVRTKDGMIYKNYGDGENYFEEIIYVSKDHCPYDSIKKDNISKASFNLIALIEVGDYVNGREVTSFGYDHNNKVIYVNTISCLSFENDEIETVLTKQQFEANAYKIEKER